MKKNYLFLLVLLFVGLNTFSQTLTKLSVEKATEIAKQKNYNEWETAIFIERATSTGVNLNPWQMPRMIIPPPSTSSANNLDFELQNFTGWTASYDITYSNICGLTTPNPATNTGVNFTGLNITTDETGLVTTGYDSRVTTASLTCVSPYGGSTSCRLGDIHEGCGSAYLSQTISVSIPDTQITMYYALVLYDGHPKADAPKFCYRIKTQSGVTVDSVYFDATQASQPGSGFYSAGQAGLYYRPWDNHVTSLAGYVGQNLTIDFYTSDCDGSAHCGYAYIDLKFGGTGNPCGGIAPQNLCFVNTNSNLDNEIYFSHSASSVAQQGTVIYRKNALGNWDSLGTVPVSQSDKFIDNTVTPALQSYTYCVAAIDSCYNNYAKSLPHSTISLQSNISTNGQINLLWNAYSGLSVSKYHIFRGSSPSTMSFLAQVSSTTFTYTDVNPPLGNDYYKIAIVAPANCTSNASPDTIVQSNFINHVITCNNSVNPIASVCFVTTNDSIHNEVYFNHTGGGLRGTIVYRQNALSNWDSIGFVPAAQPDKFIDLGVNPNQQAYVYCVEQVDSCGNKHGKTPAHTTILMQSSQGTGTQVNLSWNAYVGMPVSSYFIFRGATQFTMSQLAQVSMSTFAYTDLNPLSGNNFYRIAVLAPTNCTSNATHDTLVGSNFKTNIITGTGYLYNANMFTIYPNPANTVLNLTLKQNPGDNSEIRMINLLGDEVKNENLKGKSNLQIDISELQTGIYFVELKTQGGVFTKKIIVQH